MGERPRVLQRTLQKAGAFLVDISAADDDFDGKRVIELVCTVDGDLVVDMIGLSGPVTIPSAIVTVYGGILEGHFTKVYKTGTTATGIYAWFY